MTACFNSSSNVVAKSFDASFISLNFSSSCGKVVIPIRANFASFSENILPKLACVSANISVSPASLDISFSRKVN